VAGPAIHHLNCGTMCPRGRRLLSGDGGWLEPAHLVCHVLLIEAPDGLVLVDTGFGADDVRKPAQLTRLFLTMTRPQLRSEETAVSQVMAAGFEPGDVRHIVLTHLDVDHGGGLPDFPDAQVHVFTREYETMLNPPRRERLRYRMGAQHLAHGPLYRYASRLHPEHAATTERVLAIPPKRYERPLITFLTQAEIDALINAPDAGASTGRRASELVSLTIGDAHLGTGAHVSCFAERSKHSGSRRSRRPPSECCAPGSPKRRPANRRAVPDHPRPTAQSRCAQATPHHTRRDRRRVLSVTAVEPSHAARAASQRSDAPAARRRGHDRDRALARA
jgi:integrase